MRLKSKKNNNTFTNQLTEDDRIFRINLENIISHKNLKTILISSSVKGEGKTSLSYNLALSFADKKSDKILLVDCNLKNPQINKKFSLENKIGIANYIKDEISLKNCINNINDYLDIITVGSYNTKSDEILSSFKMKLLINEIKSSYDLIIFDSSSILENADSQIIARITDGTVLVLNPNKVNKKQALQAKKNLIQSGAEVIGIVLNDYLYKNIID